MFTMNTDPRLASQHLEEAYRIAKTLGTPFHTAAALTEMGWVSSILGEYDLALAFYDEARKRLKLQVKDEYQVVDHDATGFIVDVNTSNRITDKVIDGSQSV